MDELRSQRRAERAARNEHAGGAPPGAAARRAGNACDKPDAHGAHGAHGAHDAYGSRDEPGADGRRRARAAPWYRRLGPGLLTGASDDDPSGIATYAQAGSQFGFAMLWLTVVTLPLMVAVQLASAHVGRGDREGLIAAIRRYYGAPLAKTLVVLVALVNVANVGADLSAMGDATALLVGGKSYWFALAYGAGMFALQVRLPYPRYARYLKWLSIALFAYVIEVALVDVDWAAVAHALVAPRIAFSHEYATTAVAVLGTTISPYLFVWQAALEVEEIAQERRAGTSAGASRKSSTSRGQGRRILIDTWVGMLASNVVAFCIMLTASAVFFAHGVHDIATTRQAAKTLEPIAGRAAFLLFACGIVVSGLLAIPAFASSAAYGFAEAWRFRASMNAPLARAPLFYAVIGACLAVGVALCFSPINPIKALYWSAVLNGVAAVPMLAMVMRLASRRDVVGRLTNGIVLNMLGWSATALMAVAVGVMVFDLVS